MLFRNNNLHLYHIQHKTHAVLHQAVPVSTVAASLTLESLARNRLDGGRHKFWSSGRDNERAS